MLVLDGGYRLGKYITHYKLNYIHQKPYDQWNWFVSPQAAARIHTKVSDLAMYVNPEEVLKLPPISHMPISVELPKPIMNHYKELEAIAITKIKETVLTAANAAVLTNKLRQFTSGVIYTNAEHDVEEIHTAKFDALDDLVEELAGDPLLLIYNFNHELEVILKKYPKALAIRGGMTGKQLDKILSEWGTGDLPLLCAQSDAVAYGLNLQVGGRNMCWFSQTYNLEVYSQTIARIYRQGQKNHVRIYHLIVPKTIDEVVHKVLANKDITQKDLFSALENQLGQM